MKFFNKICRDQNACHGLRIHKWFGLEESYLPIFHLRFTVLLLSSSFPFSNLEIPYLTIAESKFKTTALKKKKIGTKQFPLSDPHTPACSMTKFFLALRKWTQASDLGLLPIQKHLNITCVRKKKKEKKITHTKKIFLSKCIYFVSVTMKYHSPSRLSRQDTQVTNTSFKRAWSGSVLHNYFNNNLTHLQGYKHWTLILLTGSHLEVLTATVNSQEYIWMLCELFYHLAIISIAVLCQ